MIVDEIVSEERAQSRRAMTRAVKSNIVEQDAEVRHQSLCQLPAQGEMMRCWKEMSPDLWVRALNGLPPEPLKFVLNSPV